MKYKEINNLSDKEIKDKLIEESDNLRKFKFAHAISPIENPIQIRNTRRLIAKLKTNLRFKGIQTTKSSKVSKNNIDHPKIKKG